MLDYKHGMVSKVSIVTPVFNATNYISETYTSILSQTYKNWEWVITDDCSTDGSYELLLELSKNDSRIKLYRNESNSGAAVSRNNSIRCSEGKFLAFLDSDDFWRENKLYTQIDFMLTHNVAFSFTAYDIVDENRISLNKTIDMSSPLKVSYKDMLRKKATMGCSTVILDRDGINCFEMPLIRTGQDYAYWLAILRNGTNAYLLRDSLTEYRILPDSISRNKLKKALRQWSIYRNFEKLNFFHSLLCFLFYAFRAFFR